jgi:hypothetical protein
VRTILNAHSSNVNCAAAFVPTDNCDNYFSIISCSKDKSEQVVVWDFSNNSPMNQKQCNAVTSLVIYDPKDAQNSNPIALVGDIKNCTIIWDIVIVEPLYELHDHLDRINSVAVFPVKEYSGGYEFFLATSSSDKTAIIRKLKKSPTGSLDHFLLVQSRTIKHDFFFLCVGFTFFSDSSEPYLVVGGDFKCNESNLWNVNSLLNNEDGSEPTFHNLVGHKGMVRSIVSFSAKDGTPRLATGSYDNSGTLFCFDLHHQIYFYCFSDYLDIVRSWK